MAEKIQDVTVRFKLDTKQVKTEETKSKKLFDDTNKAISKQKLLIREVQKDLKFLIQARNRANNPKKVKLLNAEIRNTQLRLREVVLQNSKVDKGFGRLSTTIKRLGITLLAAFSIRALSRFGNELFDIAIKMEAFQRRAQVVFGEAFDSVKDFADKTANSLGLTKSEFLGAAAAIGDIIVPLGFAREEAAKMSVEALKVASALKIFAGDSRSVQDISQLVANAFTGELLSLKSLGIAINQQDKDFKELVKIKMEAEGVTQGQARALAIYETIMLKSTDAIRSQEDSSDSLVSKQIELGANWRELKEILALELTPALNDLTADLLEQVKTLKSELLPNWQKFLGVLNPFSAMMNTVKIAVREVAIEQLAEDFKLLTDEQLKGSTALQSLLDGLISTGIETKKARELIQEYTQSEIKRRASIIDTDEATKEQIRNAFFLRAEIKKLNEEFNDINTTRERDLEITKELIPLQDELAFLTGKETIAIKEQDEAVKEAEKAWKRLIKTLDIDFKETLGSTKESMSEFDEEFNKIIEDLQLFGEGVTDIANATVDLRLAQIDSVQAVAGIISQVVEQNTALQKALFLFTKFLAAGEIFINMQREIALIGATIPDLALKTALILAARARATAGIASVIATTIPEFTGLAEGEIDIQGGTKGKDSIPSLLMPGESIMTTKETKDYKPLFEAIRKDELNEYLKTDYIPQMQLTDANMGNEVMFDDYRLYRTIKANQTVSIRNTGELARQIAAEMQSQNYNATHHG